MRYGGNLGRFRPSHEPAGDYASEKIRLRFEASAGHHVAGWGSPCLPVTFQFSGYILGQNKH